MEKEKKHQVTAVWRDWGFSGISVFLLPLRSAENTRFQKSPTTPSAKTLAPILEKMTKHIKIFLFFLTLSACGQNATEMKTAKNTEDKFAEFIAKKKFIEENYYPGIADEKMRPIFTEKINQVANDFKIVSESEKPTDLKYQEKIKIGLLRFSDVYMDLDTEDRERVCSYFEELMNIVKLESSEGQLNKFMYGFDPNEMTKKN